MWNFRQFGVFQFLTEKFLQRRTFKTGWNFDIFSMFSKIHETYRIHWNHHQKHACEIWGISEKLQFLMEKCLQPRTLKTVWNFDIFSMFSKIHETYRIYWNHHQKLACEIWGSLEKFQFLTEKCLQRRTFKIGWNFDIFLNVLQNSWNLQNLLESPPETCMWNLRQFGEVTIFDGKMPTAPDLQNWMKFRHFLNVLQNSWNLQKLLESPPETCMWNLRQFGEVTIFDWKMPTAPFKIGWNFDIFSMFSKIHETYRIYWNHHQKHACEIWGSLEKFQFLTEKCL